MLKTVLSGKGVAMVSVLVFYVTCNDISVAYLTAQMCMRTEEVVPTVELPTLYTFRSVL